MINIDDPNSILKYFTSNAAEKAIKDFSQLKGKKFLFKENGELVELGFITKAGEDNKFRVFFVSTSDNWSQIFEFSLLNDIPYSFDTYSSII